MNNKLLKISTGLFIFLFINQIYHQSIIKVYGQENSQNLILNQTVINVSSTAEDSNPNWAVDDNLNTVWTSDHDKNQWIAFDLGKNVRLGQVVVKWGKNFATDYSLELSDNKINYYPVLTKLNKDYSGNLGYSGRFILVRILSGITDSYDLANLEVYEASPPVPTPINTPIPHASVTVSEPTLLPTNLISTPTSLPSLRLSPSPLSSQSALATASPTLLYPTITPIAQQVPCLLEKAYWVTPSYKVKAKTQVGLKVEASGNCQNKVVSFQVINDRGILPSQSAKYNPTPIKLNANQAVASWQTEFISSGILDIFNPPKFYFKATLEDETNSNQNVRGATTIQSDQFLTVMALGGLEITNVTNNLSSYPNSQVPQYAKFELTFDINNTVATNLQLPYDPVPPPGLEGRIGISVEGLFLPPGQSDWQNAQRQPGFLYQDYERQLISNREWLYPTGEPVWKVRFTPKQMGKWQYQVRVQDASICAEGLDPCPNWVKTGTSSFTVGPPEPGNHGFVEVSKTDSRYFTMSDGSRFAGLGHAADDPAAKIPEYAGHGIDFLRVWMAGSAIAGSAWGPWTWFGGPSYGGYIPDPGISLAPSGSEYDYVLKLNQEQSRLCLMNGFYQGNVTVKPSTNYQLSIDVSVANITGPRDPSLPEYGFAVQAGDFWPGSCPNGRLDRNSLIPHLHDTEWTTVQTTVTTGPKQWYLGYLTLLLANTNTGVANVNRVSLREVMPNGTLGPELMTKSTGDLHKDYNLKQAWQWDNTLDQAAQYGVYLKLVVLEKNDLVWNLINWDGSMASTGNNNNFYAAPNTKVRRLHEYYWRYLAARWGYSTAVHSWELMNEGDPYNGNHYNQANGFAQFMHRVEPSRHLITTSNWHSFPTALWREPMELDYADLHAYVSTGALGGHEWRIETGTTWETDPSKTYAGSAGAIRMAAGVTSGRSILSTIQGQGVWTVSVMMRAEGITPIDSLAGPQLVVWIEDVGNFAVPINPAFPIQYWVGSTPGGTWNYKEFSRTIQVPDNNRHQIGIWWKTTHALTGTAYFDNLRIQDPNGKQFRLFGDGTFDQRDQLGYDSAAYSSAYSLLYGGGSSTNIDKPIVRGEAGIDYVGGPQVQRPELINDTHGVWLHNYLWATLNPGGMYELYWWNENIDRHNLRFQFRHLRDFLDSIPLDNGHYQDAKPAASNPNIRTLGQTDRTNGRAHLWIRNKDYTWWNVVNKLSLGTLQGTVTIPGFISNQSYPVEWWQFNLSGNLTKSQGTVTADATGNLILNLSTLPSTVTDVAVRIGNYSLAPLPGGAPSPTPIATPTPIPCTLTSASWSKQNVTKGEVVNLTITGSNSDLCSSKTVSFEVRRNGLPLIGDIPAKVQPQSVNFASGSAQLSTTWITEYNPQIDGTNPEYYFKATVQNGNTIESNPRLLTVKNTPGPQITNVTNNLSSYPNSQVPQYAKFELTFDINNTVATNLQFPYEENTPPGLPAKQGISVDGLFTTDNWSTTITQPGFLYQDYDRQADSLYPKGKPVWKVRFAPLEQGQYKYKMRATDASGTKYYPDSGDLTFITTTAQVGNHGFVKVSSADPRYFEFSDGTPFTGIGISSHSYNLTNTEKSFDMYQKNGLTLLRMWLPRYNVAGSSWGPWILWPNLYYGYIPNPGLVINPAKNSSLSQYQIDTSPYDYVFSLSYDPNDTSSAPCIFNFGYSFPVKPNTKYQISLTGRGENITGPKNSSNPGYGLTLKLAGWPKATRYNCPDVIAAKPALIPPINENSWTTKTGYYTTTSTQNNMNFFFMVMDNAQPGSKGYISEITMKEVLLDGSLGPNILIKSKSDMHYDFNQVGSWIWDYTIDLAAQKDLYLKLVVLEKNDVVFNYIAADGSMTSQYSNNNFYSAYNQGNNKVRRIEEYYWRYLTARWGYSTAVHSWELMNEGDPWNGNHYYQINDFGKYIHQIDPSRHLVSDSNWHSFPVGMWKQPNIDYADYHNYIDTDTSPHSWGLPPGTVYETNPDYVMGGKGGSIKTPAKIPATRIYKTAKGKGTWTVSVWMKVENYIGVCPYNYSANLAGPQLFVIVDRVNPGMNIPYDPNNQFKYYVCSNNFTGTQDWKQFTGSFELPTDDYYSIGIALNTQFGTSGNAWYDNLVVTSPDGRKLQMLGDGTFDDYDRLDYDTAAFTNVASTLVGAKNVTGVGKPVIRGETGISGANGEVCSAHPCLADDKQGIWLHNYLWGQINSGGMYDLYWWSDKSMLTNNLYPQYLPYSLFLKDIPINNGKYQDAQAKTSDFNLRAWGQADLTNGRAHLWIQNKNHTWKNVVDGQTITPITGTVIIPNVPSGAYKASWFNTYTGVITSTENVNTDSSGNLVLNINNLDSDIAVKIENTTITPLPSDQPTPTPIPCTLTSASWSTQSVSGGTSVDLVVKAVGACNAKIVNFEVRRNGLPLIGDIPAKIQPAATTLNNFNQATSSWITEYNPQIIGTNSDYYFKVTVQNGNTIESNPRLLTITPPIMITPTPIPTVSTLIPTSIQIPTNTPTSTPTIISTITPTSAAIQTITPTPLPTQVSIPTIYSVSPSIKPSITSAPGKKPTITPTPTNIPIPSWQPLLSTTPMPSEKRCQLTTISWQQTKQVLEGKTPTFNIYTSGNCHNKRVRIAIRYQGFLGPLGEGPVNKDPAILTLSDNNLTTGSWKAEYNPVFFFKMFKLPASFYIDAYIIGDNIIIKSEDPPLKVKPAK